MYVDFPQSFRVEGTHVALEQVDAGLKITPCPTTSSSTSLKRNITLPSVSLSTPLLPYKVYECSLSTDIPDTTTNKWDVTVGDYTVLMVSNTCFRFYVIPPSTLTLTFHPTTWQNVWPSLVLSKCKIQSCSGTLYQHLRLWDEGPSLFSAFQQVWCLDTHVSNWFPFQEQGKHLKIELHNVYEMCDRKERVFRWKSAFTSLLAHEIRSKRPWVCFTWSGKFRQDFEKHLSQILKHISQDTTAIVWGHNEEHQLDNPAVYSLLTDPKPGYRANRNTTLKPSCISLSAYALSIFREKWIKCASSLTTVEETKETILKLLQPFVHKAWICYPSLVTNGPARFLGPPLSLGQESMSQKKHILERLLVQSTDPFSTQYLSFPFEFMPARFHVSILCFCHDPGLALQQQLQSIIRQSYRNISLYAIIDPESKWKEVLTEQLLYYQERFQLNILTKSVHTLFNNLRTYLKPGYFRVCSAPLHPEELAWQVYISSLNKEIVTVSVQSLKPFEPRLHTQPTKAYETSLVPIPLEHSVKPLQKYHTLDQILFYLCKNNEILHLSI